MSILRKCYTTKLQPSRAQLLLRTVSSTSKTIDTDKSPVKLGVNSIDMESFNQELKKDSEKEKASTSPAFD